MEVLYSKDGTPLMAQGSKAIVFTSNERQPTEKTHDAFQYNDVAYAGWGGANRQPEDDELLIAKTPVLRTGLSYKCRVAHGQGVIPIVIDGYDESLNEIYKPLNNKDIINFLNDYVFESYLNTTFQNLFKFGNAFPIFTFNSDASKILRVEARSARHCRISIDKKKLLIYNDFANTMPSKNTDKQAIVLDMLDEVDPFYNLEYLKNNKKLSGKQIAFPRIKNFFSSNDYYATPDWYSARDAGWIDVAHKAVTFIKKAYENSMSIMWHVKIPYSFWEKKFPISEIPDAKERQAQIAQFLENIEKTLCGEENARKALISHFTADSEIDTRDKWEIDPIDSKKIFDEKLATSAAGNSEILFSLMVNPSVLGAGMPGGPYSGNAGSGSDIREGFTISMLLAHIEKQQTLDPVEMMLRFNGYDHVQIKYKTTFLTTLDKGKSTQSEVI